MLFNSKDVAIYVCTHQYKKCSKRIEAKQKRALAINTRAMEPLNKRSIVSHNHTTKRARPRAVKSCRRPRTRHARSRSKASSWLTTRGRSRAEAMRGRRRPRRRIASPPRCRRHVCCRYQVTTPGTFVRRRRHLRVCDTLLCSRHQVVGVDTRTRTGTGVVLGALECAHKMVVDGLTRCIFRCTKSKWHICTQCSSYRHRVSRSRLYS